MDKIRLDLLSSEAYLRLKQASDIALLLNDNGGKVTIANRHFVASVVNSLIESAKSEYEDALSEELEELGDEIKG